MHDRLNIKLYTQHNYPNLSLHSDKMNVLNMLLGKEFINSISPKNTEMLYHLYIGALWAIEIFIFPSIFPPMKVYLLNYNFQRGGEREKCYRFYNIKCLNFSKDLKHYNFSPFESHSFLLLLSHTTYPSWINSHNNGKYISSYYLVSWY